MDDPLAGIGGDDPQAPDPAIRLARRRAAHAAARRAETKRTVSLLGAAAASIAASWWLAGLYGLLSSPRIDEQDLVFPTELGRTVVLIAAVASVVTALGAFAMLWRSSTGLRRQLLGTAGLLLAPVSCGHALFSIPSTQLVGCMRQDVGDAVYVYAENVGFPIWIMEPYHAVAASLDHGFFRDRCRIADQLFENSDRGTGWPAPVLGPRGHRTSFVTKGGLVAFYAPGGGCVSVWDSHGPVRRWPDPPYRLPLLALLAPDEEPDDADLAYVRYQAQSGNGFVAEDEVMKALGDPRPAVRFAGRAIALAGGPKMYPHATDVAAATK